MSPRTRSDHRTDSRTTQVRALISDVMARLIASPTVVEAAGTPPKTIREHVGRVNTRDLAVSIAQMSSPPGWSEPWQQPEFDEWTVVLAGAVVVEDDEQSFVVVAGQAAHAPAGRRVRYSTPDGADYIAVCLPAFSPESVHRSG
jgi:quercetin dioxygenase-like cupin family protein